MLYVSRAWKISQQETAQSLTDLLRVVFKACLDQSNACQVLKGQIDDEFVDVIVTTGIHQSRDRVQHLQVWDMGLMNVYHLQCRYIGATREYTFLALDGPWASQAHHGTQHFGNNAQPLGPGSAGTRTDGLEPGSWTTSDLAKLFPQAAQDAAGGWTESVRGKRRGK